MSRTDGRKLVALAATATVGMIGIGSIYLPFMADRDKLRGLFEEGEETMPEGARKEMQALVKAELAAKAAARQQALDEQQQDMQEQQRRDEDLQLQQQRQRASAGSMWSSFRRSS